MENSKTTDKKAKLYESIRQYNKENYTKITVKVKKAKAAEFKQRCKDNLTTRNRVINKAVEKFLNEFDENP